MVYMGSKNRIAKHLLPIMLKEAEEKGLTTWVEPFVGGGNMIDKVPAHFKRIGNDFNPHSIAALIAVRDYADLGLLPTSVTEDYYRLIKRSAPDPITSFIRFVCAFGSEFEGTYARCKGSDETTYILRGVKNAEKQSPSLQGVQLIHGSYTELSHLENCLIYCDPPYENTYGYATGKFNHIEFWQWCRDMSEKNSVFVSEYNAPYDFDVLWEGSIKTHFANNKATGTLAATEKLFKYNDLL